MKNLQHFLSNQEDINYLYNFLGAERMNRFIELAANILETTPSMKDFEDFIYIFHLLQFMNDQKIPWWRSGDLSVSSYFQLKYYPMGIILIDYESFDCGMFLLLKKPFKKIYLSKPKKYNKILQRAKKAATRLFPPEIAMYV